MHKHKATSYGPDRCYQAPVGPPARQNRAAHGGITREERCSCGATRPVNINGCHEELGSWEEPRATRRWTVYHGGSMHGMGRWSGPHGSILEAQQSARRCRQVVGGAPTIEAEELPA